MSGDRIFADRGTITGSIGIYGGKLNLQKLYEKIALNKELYTRGKFAGMMSSMRPFTEEEREKQMSQIRDFYEYFVELVAANRKLSPDSVDNLGRGRVWTGQEAFSVGLVDEIGGLRSAIEYCADKLNIKDYRIEFYPQKRPLFIFPGNKLMNAVGSLFRAADAEGDNSKSELIIEEDGILARMPFDISIE
jgi:protease-4